jgi:hypothetical protein
MGKSIRRRITAGCAALLVCTGAVIALGAVSEAATTSADLAVTGSVVGGITKVAGHEHGLVFSYTLTNKGPNASGGSADLVLSVTGGSFTDIACIPPTHTPINPDGTFCEDGPLSSGQSSKDVAIVAPTAASGGKVTMRACAMNEAGADATDPVSTNNCKTLSVRVL